MRTKTSKTKTTMRKKIDNDDDDDDYVFKIKMRHVNSEKVLECIEPPGFREKYIIVGRMTMKYQNYNNDKKGGVDDDDENDPVVVYSGRGGDGIGERILLKCRHPNFIPRYPHRGFVTRMCKGSGLPFEVVTMK